MSSMSQGQMTWAFFSVFLCFVSLGLICTSIGTTNWVKTTEQKANNVSIVTEVGLWQTCTSTIKADGWVFKSCTDRELINAEDNSTEKILQLRLTQCFVIFVCLSAFIQFLTHLILLCGFPVCCKSLKKTHLFFVVSVTQLLAVLLGIVGCICFIALQDELHSKDPSSVVSKYNWSFMLAWISLGLCLIESAIFVVLVKVCFDNVFQSGKFDYRSIFGMLSMTSNSTSAHSSTLYLDSPKRHSYDSASYSVY